MDTADHSRPSDDRVNTAEYRRSSDDRVNTVDHSRLELNARVCALSFSVLELGIALESRYRWFSTRHSRLLRKREVVHKVMVA